MGVLARLSTGIGYPADEALYVRATSDFRATPYPRSRPLSCFAYRHTSFDAFVGRHDMSIDGVDSGREQSKKTIDSRRAQPSIAALTTRRDGDTLASKVLTCIILTKITTGAAGTHNHSCNHSVIENRDVSGVP